MTTLVYGPPLLTLGVAAFLREVPWIKTVSQLDWERASHDDVRAVRPQLLVRFTSPEEHSVSDLSDLGARCVLISLDGTSDESPVVLHISDSNQTLRAGFLAAASDTPYRSPLLQNSPKKS